MGKYDQRPNRVLHSHYRPRAFDEVVGQRLAVDTLISLINNRASQAFLIWGPSGTGKTTLARLAAVELGCSRQQEIDGATFTGIDAMRAVRTNLQYMPLGSDTARVAIVDEAHRISAQAWDSLLKSVEEPPRHAFWFFVTTEVKKVPPTIKSRCSSIRLNPVSDEGLRRLLSDVCDAEGIQAPREVTDVIIGNARGSPRQLLVNLAMCRNVQTRKDAEALAAHMAMGFSYEHRPSEAPLCLATHAARLCCPSPIKAEKRLLSAF